MIIRRSLTPLNSSRTLRAVRRRETVRRSDDNSRRKVQNVRGDSYRIKMGADFRGLDVFAEVFNLLDRANFTNPSGDRRLPTFLVLNGLVAGGFPRQLQIGARFGF